MDMSSLQKALEDVSPNTQADMLCRDILEATITEMAEPHAVPRTPQVQCHAITCTIQGLRCVEQCVKFCREHEK
jgi:hypothetical protein